MRWRRAQRKGEEEDMRAETENGGGTAAPVHDAEIVSKGASAHSGTHERGERGNGKGDGVAVNGHESRNDSDNGGRPKREMHIDLIMHDVANLFALPVVSSIGLLGLAGIISPRHSTFTIFFYILVDLIWILKRPAAIPNLYAVIVTHHFVVLLLVRPQGRMRALTSPTPR